MSVLLALCDEAKAQTSLSVGDIQVTGVTADDADSFTFVVWKDISASTVIRFMDQSFTNATTGVLGSENDMSLTFSSDLTSGTVIRVENGGTTLTNGGTFSGTKTGSLSGIALGGDQVFVYQGTAMGGGTDFTGRTLLYGLNIANSSWLTSGTATTTNSYLPSSINLQDANLDTGNRDNADYNGARTGMTTAAYRAAVANLDNFTESNSRFDLGTGGFTIDGNASLHWDANGTTSGDGGSGTWDTTTQSRFKNGASGSTYLHWVNSSSGNEHTAVFGGIAGTVSVAAGGVTASGLQFDATGYTIQNNAITLSGSSPGISVTTGSAIISSTLQGTNGMTKSGAGTLILSAANTYTGASEVNEGTLIMNGDQTLATGAVSVASAATLGGDGTIGGDTTVSGNLRVGSNTANGTTGSLDFSGENLTFAGNSTWFIDIIGAANDSLTGIDVLSIDSSATLSFNFSSPSASTYTLATYSSRIGSEFTGFSNGSIFSGYQINYGSTAITLTAVPEPGTLGLLGLAVGGLLWRQFRRSKIRGRSHR